MKKNVASQTIGAQVVSATDGSAFTGEVLVYITGDGGTQTLGSVGSDAGLAFHEGNGYHSYAPTQAETNYDHIAFTFVGTGAIPATVQVYTTFPQTGDSFARIGSTGSGLTSLASAADLATVDGNVDSILEDTGTTLPATLATIAGYIDTEVAAVLAAVDTEIAAILADTNELQTDWADGGRLDLILDARASQASVDAVDNFVDTEVTAIKGVTDKLDGMLSATSDAWQFTVDALELAPGGDIPSAAEIADAVWDEAASGHVSAGSFGKALGDTDERGANTVVRGTADTGATTTSIPTSAFSPDGGAEDQFKGRIVVFDNDTTTAALRGQATDITASSNSATPTLTVTALTTAPASGDSFSVL